MHQAIDIVHDVNHGLHLLWFVLILANINPLHATFFSGNIKNWYGTVSWHPSPLKPRTYLFYIGSIMGADVLAMQGYDIDYVEPE